MLIAEILTDEPDMAVISPTFNTHISMGWHRLWNRAERNISQVDYAIEKLIFLKVSSISLLLKIK